MKQFIKQNGIYFLLYGIILLFCASLLLSEDKVQIHGIINSYVGHPIIDVFFKYFTHLGDGAFAILLIAVFYFINVKKANYILFSYTSSALLTGILKIYFYSPTWRPAFVYQYFATNNHITLIDGVEMHYGNSFPSGHATSAFAVFICLLLITNIQWQKILFLLMAILAAYSRTYLSQHWLVDIVIGSIIGTSFALLFYAIYYLKNTNNKYNVTIINLLNKKNKSV